MTRAGGRSGDGSAVSASPEAGARAARSGPVSGPAGGRGRDGWRPPLPSIGMRALLARRGATADSPDRATDRGAAPDVDGAGPNGAAPKEAGAGTPAARRAHGIRLATRIAAVVAGLGLVACVVFGAMWWMTLHGSAAKAAATRDDALTAARQIAVNLQTLDYNTVDQGLTTWENSVTGPLLDEFKKGRDQYAAAMRAAQTSTNARVVDAALSDLDVPAGKAKAVVAVDVTTTRMVNGAPSLPVTKQVRIQLDLVRTPDAGWKADAISAM